MPEGWPGPDESPVSQGDIDHRLVVDEVVVAPDEPASRTKWQNP
jgi:hypothetical protein